MSQLIDLDTLDVGLFLGVVDRLCGKAQDYLNWEGPLDAEWAIIVFNDICSQAFEAYALGAGKRDVVYWDIEAGNSWEEIVKSHSGSDEDCENDLVPRVIPGTRRHKDFAESYWALCLAIDSLIRWFTKKECDRSKTKVQEFLQACKIYSARVRKELLVPIEGDIHTERANTAKLFSKGVPAKADIVDLVAHLDAAKGSGKSDIAVAREFKNGDDKKAKSLLAQIYRMRRKGRLSK